VNARTSPRLTNKNATRKETATAIPEATTKKGSGRGRSYLAPNACAYTKFGIKNNTIPNPKVGTLGEIKMFKNMSRANAPKL